MLFMVGHDENYATKFVESGQVIMKINITIYTGSEVQGQYRAAVLRKGIPVTGKTVFFIEMDSGLYWIERNLSFYHDIYFYTQFIRIFTE